MKMFLLLIAPVGVMLATTMSASAQSYPDAGLNRLDDPNYGFVQSQWRRGYGGYDAYAGNGCRVIRERIVLPDGREIYSSRQICG
jgi:hypothetical protein